MKELIVAGLLLGSRDIYGGMSYVQELDHMDDSGEMEGRKPIPVQPSVCFPGP